MDENIDRVVVEAPWTTAMAVPLLACAHQRRKLASYRTSRKCLS